MKKADGYLIRGAVSLYSAKELKAQFGIDVGVLKLLERHGLLTPVKGFETSRCKYNLTEVKYGLAVIAQNLPTEDVSGLDSLRAPDLSKTPGWVDVLRKAITRNRNLPSLAMAEAVFDELRAALCSVATSQAKILIPGIGSIVRVAVKEREYKFGSASKPNRVPAHEAWRLRVAPRIKKAVRQHTTKKVQKETS